jgi:hypothetical protein
MTTFNIDATEYVCNKQHSNYTKVGSDNPKILKIKVNGDHISDDISLRWRTYESGWLSLSDTTFKFSKELFVNYVEIFLEEDGYVNKYKFNLYKKW